MEHAKKSSCFCLKKLNHPRFANGIYTNAVTSVCDIFELFQDQQKNCNFCCFLFLNYGRKVELLRVTRLMSKASKRFLRNE